MASILDLFPGYAAERERVQRLSQGGFPAQADDFAQSFVPFYGAGKSGLQGDYGSALAQGAVEAGLTFAPALKKPVGGLLGLVRSAFARPEAPAPAPRRAPPQPQQRPIDEVAREREMGDYQGSRVNAQAEWQSRYSQAAMDAAQGNMTPDAVFFNRRMPDQFAAEVRRAGSAPPAQLEDMPLDPRLESSPLDANSQFLDDLLAEPDLTPPTPPKPEAPAYRRSNKKDRLQIQDSIQSELQQSNRRPSDFLSADDVTRDELAQAYALRLRNPKTGLTPSPTEMRGRLDNTMDRLTTIYKSAGGGDAGEAALRNRDLTNRAFGRRGTLSQAGVGVGIGASAAVSDEDFLAEMRAYLSEFGQ